MSMSTAAKKPSHRRRRLLQTCLFLLLIVLLGGCSSAQSPRLWLNAPGWSRAQNIGTAGTMRRISLDVDDEGTLYAVYFEKDPDTVLTVIAVRSSGEESWRTSFDTANILEGRYPTLLCTPEGIWVYWIVSGDLVELALTHEGEIISLPEVVTNGESVIYYDVARGPEGERTIWFSSSRDHPGIYRVDPFGSGMHTTLVDPTGVYPDVEYGSDGVLHAVWAYSSGQLENTTFEYHQFVGGFTERLEAARTIRPGLRTSDDVTGPLLGFDGLVVQVYWSASIRTGLRAGEIENMIASFVPGFPDTYAAPQRILVATDFELPYEAWSGAIQAGPRVDWDYNLYGTDQLKDIAPLVASEGESVVAMRARINTRSGQSQSQIALAFLKDGVLDSYQLLTFTYASSVTPSLIEGPDGSLYAVWLEITNEDEFSIYLSGTTPMMRESYNSLTPDDYRQMASDTLFGIVSDLLLAPVIFIWLIPAMLTLALTAWLRRGEGRGQDIRTAFCVLLAAGVYWATKLGFFPAIQTSIPFKAWIPVISDPLGRILQIAVPLVIMLIALGFSYRSMRKRGAFSPTIFILVYILWDGLLTLGIYGVDFIRM